jgi:hypothetical protein
MNESYRSVLEEAECYARNSTSISHFESQILPGNRRCTQSLLPDSDDEDTDMEEEEEDDDDDMYIPNQTIPVCNQRREQVNLIQKEEVEDSQVFHVLEIFPMANPRRIQYLLRSESLNTAMLILAQELTDTRPSDEIVGPLGLSRATTYSQASENDQAFLLKHLSDIFPMIAKERIESTLMDNSTYQAVAILSQDDDDITEVTEIIPKSSDSSLPKVMRRNLTDSGEGTWRPDIKNRK